MENIKATNITIGNFSVAITKTQYLSVCVTNTFGAVVEDDNYDFDQATGSALTYPLTVPSAPEDNNDGTNTPAKAELKFTDGHTEIQIDITLVTARELVITIDGKPPIDHIALTNGTDVSPSCDIEIDIDEAGEVDVDE